MRCMDLNAPPLHSGDENLYEDCMPQPLDSVLYKTDSESSMIVKEPNSKVYAPPGEVLQRNHANDQGISKLSRLCCIVHFVASFGSSKMESIHSNNINQVEGEGDQVASNSVTQSQASQVIAAAATSKQRVSWVWEFADKGTRVVDYGKTYHRDL